MTTLRGPNGATVLHPHRGDVLVVDRRNPDLVAVIPDPTGALGEVLRACAARDRRRREEKQS